MEDPDERRKLHERLLDCKHEGTIVKLSHLFQIKEYPKDWRPLYSQGYSVTCFLIAQGNGGDTGRRKFAAFVKDLVTIQDNNLTKINAALKKHYGYPSADHLETKWLAWVNADTPGCDMRHGCGAKLAEYKWTPPARGYSTLGNTRYVSRPGR